jgi:hypothetical protein
VLSIAPVAEQSVGGDQSNGMKRIQSARAAVQSMVSCARASLDALAHRRIEAHHKDLEDFQFVIIEQGERTLRLLDVLELEL